MSTGPGLPGRYPAPAVPQPVTFPRIGQADAAPHASSAAAQPDYSGPHRDLDGSGLLQVAVELRVAGPDDSLQQARRGNPWPAGGGRGWILRPQPAPRPAGRGRPAGMPGCAATWRGRGGTRPGPPHPAHRVPLRWPRSSPAPVTACCAPDQAGWSAGNYPAGTSALWPQCRLRAAGLVPVGRCCTSRVCLHAGKVEQPRNGPNLPFRSTSVP